MMLYSLLSATADVPKSESPITTLVSIVVIGLCVILGGIYFMLRSRRK